MDSHQALCAAAVVIVVFCLVCVSRPTDARAARMAQVARPPRPPGVARFVFSMAGDGAQIPAHMIMTAQLTPTSSSASTSGEVVFVDLRRALFQNHGHFVLDTEPGHKEYDVRIVNGNPHTPLVLRGLTHGHFKLYPDSSVLDQRTGERYSLALASANLIEVNGSRQRTPAFTAAFRACPSQGTLRAAAQGTDNGPAPAPEPARFTLLHEDVPMGGPQGEAAA